MLLAQAGVHALSPPCSHHYRSPLLAAVAEADLAGAAEEIRRAGMLDPDLGAEALAVAIRPYTTSCQRPPPSPAVFSWLVQQGAQVNRPTVGPGRLEGTSLMHAAEAGQVEMADLALRHGARADVAVGGVTPLTLAISGGKTDVVRLLLRHGADPNFADGASSPLALAARYPGPGNEVLKLLIAGGARQPAAGDQPLDGMAHYFGRPEDAAEAVELLVRAGGRVDGNGPGAYESPLGNAMESSHTQLEVVEALLRNGADPNGSALYRLMHRRDASNTVSRAQLLGLLYRYGARAEKARMPGYPPLREAIRRNLESGQVRMFQQELESISRQYEAHPPSPANQSR